MKLNKLETMLTEFNMESNGYEYKFTYGMLDVYKKGDLRVMLKPESPGLYSAAFSYYCNDNNTFKSGLYEPIQLDLFENMDVRY